MNLLTGEGNPCLCSWFVCYVVNTHVSRSQFLLTRLALRLVNQAPRREVHPDRDWQANVNMCWSGLEGLLLRRETKTRRVYALSRQGLPVQNDWRKLLLTWSVLKK